MNTPKIQMVENAYGTGYAMLGFEAFDHWAKWNIPAWHRITMICKTFGYDDAHRMKLLACELALQNGKLIDENINIVLQSCQNAPRIAWKASTSVMTRPTTTKSLLDPSTHGF